MNLTKKNDCGRSMIEMLGVLAIIAVLTVGGIAGFSKAMQKWKSNIQRQAIAEFVAAAIKMKSNLNPQTTTYENVTSVIYAMGDLPEGTTYQNGYIYDKEGNYFRVSYGRYTSTKEDGSTSTSFLYGIILNFAAPSSTTTPSILDTCQNVILTLQQVASEVNYINVGQTDSQSYNGYTHNILYTKSTLATTTVAEIHQKCKILAENGEIYRFGIFLNPY